MSIVDKYIKKITCKEYKAISGTKRCVHYGARGTCKLPSENMCTEWLKVNYEKTKEEQPLDIGVPTKVGADDSENEDRPRIVIARKEQHADEPYVIPESDIEELEKTKLTMVLSADEFDEEVFVVPAYTEEKDSRIELNWRDLATITTMVSVFPGSRVVKVRKNRKA